MQHFPNRIRELRKARDLTLEQLADAVDTSTQQIGRLEKGERKLTVEWMQRLAPALNVTPADLLSTEANPTLPEPNVIPPFSVVRPVSLRRFGAHPPEPRPNDGDIPILGTARGGDAQEMFTDDPIDFHPMPGFLAKVRGAYGLIVVGESMHPRYRDGVTIYINPHARPYPGSGVVIVKNRPDNGHTHGYPVLVKEFVRNTPLGIEVLEYKPVERQFLIPREEIYQIHVIAGTKE